MKARLIFALSIALSFATHVTAQEMPGGLWEIKTKMDIPGMPPEMAEKFSNRTMTHCIKPFERKWTEQQRNPGGREPVCEQTDVKAEGNKYSWKMKCADGMTGDGSVTHNGRDAYTMDVQMNSPRGDMKIHSEGKRIAESCEKK